MWIDPVIATGYSDTVTGAEFASVTAPSLAVVPDGDAQCTLTFDSTAVTLASGATCLFGPGVTSFTLTAIDPDLSLDLLNAIAFPTGISLTNFMVTQTPITEDIGTPAPSPLPAGGFLLAGAVLGLSRMRARRGRRCAMRC